MKRLQSTPAGNEDERAESDITADFERSFKKAVLKTLLYRGKLSKQQYERCMEILEARSVGVTDYKKTSIH